MCPRVGCAAILRRGKKILLGKRGKEPQRGKWILPGGGVKEFERLKTTLIREIQEETGLVIKIDGLFNVYEIINPPSEHRIIVYWLASYTSGKLQANSDLLDADFFSEEEVKSLISENRVTETVVSVLQDYWKRIGTVKVPQIEPDSDHHLKNVEDSIVRYLEMPITELERTYALQFTLALAHFKDAIKLWRIFMLRHNCAQCHKIRNLRRSDADAPCPTCGEMHGSLSEVDTCTYSASTISNFIALLQCMVETFTDNFPVVFPAVVEALSKMIKQLTVSISPRGFRHRVVPRSRASSRVARISFLIVFTARSENFTSGIGSSWGVPV